MDGVGVNENVGGIFLHSVAARECAQLLDISITDSQDSKVYHFGKVLSREMLSYIHQSILVHPYSFHEVNCSVLPHD